MELDVNILRDMLTERGFYPGNRGNEHVWKNVINGIPYAVDFRIGSVFRYMYGQREEDVEDEELVDLKTAIIAAMQDTTGGQDVQAPEATNQEPEIPPTEENVTREDKAIETKQAKAPAPRPAVPARSRGHAVSIQGYTREQIEALKNTVAKGANDSEFQMFMHVAQTYGLDPFLKEIYYSNQIHTIITSRDGYLKAAQRDPDFEGIQSMAVCENDEFSVDVVQGTVKHSFGKGTRGDVIGAWAICYRHDRKPVISYASYDEYNQGNQVWKKYKSAMCCKVAEVFALKRQFGISGLLTAEEMGVE